jgi:hypothetical protein
VPNDSFQNFERDMARSMAATDQTVQRFKAFYLSRSAEERAAFAAWVRRLSEPLGTTIDEWVSMIQAMGCSNDGIVDVRVSLNAYPDGESVSIYPPYLREAIDRWEKGEEFTPPLGADLAG